jgi:DNA integrity scanning protein DisA with diadenylate cyclase activity
MNTSKPTTPTSFFGSSFFSSVTSSVNAISQTIQTKGIPEINKRLNEIQQKARELPSQLATLQGDLESERALFVQNKKLDEKNGHVNQAKGSGKIKEINMCLGIECAGILELVAPWAGYQGYESEMKQAIMDISKVKE